MLKNSHLKFFILTLGFFLLPFASTLADVNNFYIESFYADYLLSVDENNMNRLQVREEITAVFPNFDQNHGILRAIPIEYKNNSLNISIESVTDEFGDSREYTTYEENDNLVLRIGNPNAFVHGTTTYQINYELENVISFYDEHQELYWDVNGDQWPQRFGEVSATLRMSDELENALLPEKFCFAGEFGSTGTDCSIEETSEGITFSTENLSPRETLTLVASFEDETFPVPPRTFSYDDFKWLWLILLPLATLIYMWRRWSKFGKDPKGKGVIVRQYDLPQGMTAIKANALLNEGRLEPKAVTATIIELAVAGYLNILEKEEKSFFKKNKKYELELKRQPLDAPEHLREVSAMIFGEDATEGARVSLEDKQYKFASDFKALSKKESDKLFREGYFASDPQKVRGKYFGVAIVLAFVTFFSFMFGGIFVGLGLLASAFIVAVFAIIMPVKTKMGVETTEHILGLKEYMMQAEKGRIDVMQGPGGAEKSAVGASLEDKVHLFEKLLPYAMFFGIEKGWVEIFADIYREAPEWYRGNMAAWSANSFADSLDGINTASSAMFTTPSSSGGSGSGGGGFSGGGGGGGGGGGW